MWPPSVAIIGCWYLLRVAHALLFFLCWVLIQCGRYCQGLEEQKPIKKLEFMTQDVNHFCHLLPKKPRMYLKVSSENKKFLALSAHGLRYIQAASGGETPVLEKNSMQSLPEAFRLLVANLAVVTTQLGSFFRMLFEDLVFQIWLKLLLCWRFVLTLLTLVDSLNRWVCAPRTSWSECDMQSKSAIPPVGTWLSIAQLFPSRGGSHH